MIQSDIKKIVEDLVQTFLDVGKISLDLRRKGLTKEIKSDNTPVSNGDIEVNDLITKEISIGEFVVSGGELPAAVLCDSIIRLLPGIIGDESSALSDTFQDNLVSAPIYTRPEVYKGLQVPKVLLSGNKKEIQKWNDEKSIERTKLLRPKLFDNE